MRDSFREIAQFMDSVEPATDLSRLLEMHQLERGDSFAEVWRRHNHVNIIEQRLISFNTFLMDIPGEGRKPAVEYRDSEIGEYLASNFDICCLSEVWHKEERNDILDEWNSNTHVAHRSGNNTAIGMLWSSGLMTISRSIRILKEDFCEYENETGSDKKADKGCLLTVLEVNSKSVNTPSNLNIYSTHLNAEGDAKYYQIFELINFIRSTMDKVSGDKSRPGRPGLNANILCGDFNLNRFAEPLSISHVLNLKIVKELPDKLRNAVAFVVSENGEITTTRASGKNGFHILRDLLAVLGFKDLWETRNGSSGYTSDLTNEGVIEVIARQDSSNNFYCDDDINAAEVTQLTNRISAIDHMFFTPTGDMMGFTIDFTRPRRPYTIRPPHPRGHNDGINFLSDHLGISTTLLIAPK